MYQAFGLTIDSCLKLTELPRGDGPVDVAIRFGAVPNELSDASDRGVCFQTARRQSLILLPGIGRFLMTAGREIVIDPADNVDGATLRLFVLSYCIGALLHQRGLLVLHASVVGGPDGCVAMAGASSLGKSALAAKLLDRGYSLVTDEVCAVRLSEAKTPHVLPGYPCLSLWRRTLEKLDVAPASLRATRPGLEKYVLPTDRFADSPQRLTHLYSLEMASEPGVTVTPVEGFEQYTSLLKNTYRERYLIGMETRRARHRICAAGAPNMQVRRLRWSRQWNDLDAAITLIEADLAQSREDSRDSVAA